MKIELLDNKKDWFIENPSPIAPAKFVTIGLLRKTMDYVAFRTEADKTINSVVTPISSENLNQIERVILLASKQKAVERRKAEQLIRGVKSNYKCYLKDALCLSCPVCILNGGIGLIKKEKGKEISIRSRVLYQTAFSLESLEESIETLTFNAVDENTTKTGQALNERELIKPGTHFISVVSILAPTLEELKFTLKYISATTRYGAETRGVGILENKIIGISMSNSEITSALELLLETNLTETISSETMSEDKIQETLNKSFLSLSQKSGAQYFFDLKQINTIEESIRTNKLHEGFINSLFMKSSKMTELIEEASK